MTTVYPSVYLAQPGDVFNSPQGEPMHVEPRIVLPGWQAAAFLLNGGPVGVLVIRPWGSELRYYDDAGVVHKEPVIRADVETTMRIATNRICALIRHFLGERHPLADRPTANKVPV